MPAAATEQDRPASLENRLQDAYLELSTQPQDWVYLSDLREKLGNPDNAEFERVLRTMVRTGFVHLAPDSIQRRLTPAHREGAVRFGNEAKHLIVIEPDFFDQSPSAREGNQ